jgi:hypothetical protein
VKEEVDEGVVVSENRVADDARGRKEEEVGEKVRSPSSGVEYDPRSTLGRGSAVCRGGGRWRSIGTRPFPTVEEEERDADGAE